MLKGRNSLYVFLPVNLLLWGYIGYKLYTSFGEGEEALPDEFPVTVARLKDADSLTYELSLNYEDPFLKNVSVRAVQANNAAKREAPKTKPVDAKPAPVQKEARVTDIKYLGLIHNKSSGVKTALISINGQSHIIKPGETVNGIAVQQVDKDFIVVKEGKEKTTITR
ncbi:MAG: hypothetical protein ACXVPQ_05035 [Bacteroidia bacterium]